MNERQNKPPAEVFVVLSDNVPILAFDKQSDAEDPDGLVEGRDAVQRYVLPDELDRAKSEIASLQQRLRFAKSDGQS